MGIDLAEADSAIRISCGWNTVFEDIDRLIAAWQELYIRVTQSDIGQPSARRAA
jgi:cysteine desulfurase